MVSGCSISRACGGQVVDEGRDIIADAPPAAASVTDYDLAHAKHYLRLLDADAEHADWREAATLVLGLDCEADPARAERIHAAHLDRARWMTREGYRHLLTSEDA